MHWTDPFIEDFSDHRGFYDVVRTLDDLKALIDKLGSSDSPVAFDIETGYTGPPVPKGALDVYLPHQFIVGFSLTNDLGWARYVPLKHDFGFNLDPHVVWPMVKPLLEQSTLVCHNWAFEARNVRALDWKGDGPRIDLDWRLAHDSMLQSYVLSETPVHNLKDLTMLRYSYEQTHIQTLFGDLTAKQQACLRFNVLDVNPAVVNYVCDDVCWSLRLDRDQRPRCEKDRRIIYQLEREVLGIIAEMADTGIAVDWDGIETDLGRFDFFYQQMETRTRRLFEEAAGRDLTALNFRSAIQMRQLLFDDLGLRSSRMTKPNKDGESSLSTDETALEALRHQHPAVEQLLKYRQTKKMGEWFQLWHGLRTAVDERVHPSLNQVRVQSGRFASDAPNVQNITKKWWFTIRDRDLDAFPATRDGDAAFEAHVKATGTNGIDYWAGNARDFLVASPGYRLLTFDYSAAEMRILAGLSEEPYLLQAFEHGMDVHKVAASLAFHVPLDQVSPEQRQRAKSVQFGLVYGQGPKGLADGLGISQTEASEIMAQYFAAFSKVDQWFNQVKFEGKSRGYVESFLGRKSTIWQLQSPSKAEQSKADRMCVNIPVQGGAADYCKLAMVKAKRELVRLGWWGGKVRLLMNQHDSLVFEVAEELALTEVRDILQPMVSFPLRTAELVLPTMVVDWEYGQRWGTLAKLTDTEPEKVSEVSAPSPEPDRDELQLAVEVVLHFDAVPTRDEAGHLLDLLRRYPGERPVLIAVGGREGMLRGTTVSPDLLGTGLNGFDCTLELRPIP